MSVWKSVGQQLGKLGKHVANQVASEPLEVVKNAVGEPNKMEQGVSTSQAQASQKSSDDSASPKGFANPEDHERYSRLAPRRDEMEMAIIRKNLQREFGLKSDLESGMQSARQEYLQKEEERKKIVEQAKEEKKLVLEEKKNKENLAVVAARQASSAENRAWGAG